MFFSEERPVVKIPDKERVEGFSWSETEIAGYTVVDVECLGR